MTGTGTYTISNLEAAHFDPAVFKGAGALAGVVDMTPEALVEAVTGELAAAPFAAPSVTGSFNIAGGILRSPNLAITGTDAQIFGGASLTLPTLALDARYATLKAQFANKAALHAIFHERFASNTREHWLVKLEEQDLLCAPVRDLREALVDPQTLHNKVLMEGPGEGQTVRFVGSPIQMSAAPVTLRRAPP
eukprot:gene12269-16524_t